MDKKVLTFLKSYSFDPIKIDRLIVSNFLYSNNLVKTINLEIGEYLITDSSDDYQVLLEFIEIHKFLSIEDIISAFEFVISPKEKVVSGAIYTPESIRNFIVKETVQNFQNIEAIKVCDPACGCSGFLYSIAKTIKSKTGISYKQIFEYCLFGLDIQEYSVKRSILLLSLFSIFEGEDSETFKFNIFQGNALNFNWEQNISNFKGFDIVIGNPPYVCSRNIEEKSKELLLNWSVCSSGHPDLYIPFFEIGLSILKQGGFLGYITMNTFFKSLNGRALREFFNKSRYHFSIIDFGSYQVFNSKSTYTCICLIKKAITDSIKYKRLTSIDDLNLNDFKFNNIDYLTLNSLNGWNLQEKEILNKIESIGVPLGVKFKSRNGIATLKNDIYIFAPVKEDDNFYYLKNGDLYPIEKGICSNIINPNKLVKGDSGEPIMKKIIFPYCYEKGKVKLIKEGDFKQDFPYAYNYMLDKKLILATRDNGNGNYEAWYAYGRNQSLDKLRYKLFFPHITPSIPKYLISVDENLLFYNGLAIIGTNERDLLFIKKIMSSRLFWFYITNSSKPYGAGYFSLSRNYIKNFGIFNFSEEEKEFLIIEKDQPKLDDFIESRYGIKIR